MNFKLFFGVCFMFWGFFNEYFGDVNVYYFLFFYVLDFGMCWLFGLWDFDDFFGFVVNYVVC